MAAKNGGMEETQSRDRSDSGGRVHFKDAQVTPDHQGEIVVNVGKDGVFDAHIGFLQEKRNYSIQVTLPKYLGDEVSLLTKVPDITVKEFKTTPSKDKHVIIFEWAVAQHGVVNKEIHLQDAANHKYTLKSKHRPSDWVKVRRC